MPSPVDATTPPNKSSVLFCTHALKGTTVWPEILAGNLFWRIGGFESNPPIFLPPKICVII